MNVFRAEPLLMARFQRGGGLCFAFSWRRLLQARRRRSRPVADPDDDQQDEDAEREVNDRADRALGGAGRTRSGQQEHEQQTAGDARQSRAEEIAEEEPLWIREREHDRDRGQQRRVQRCGQGDDEYATHALRLREPRARVRIDDPYPWRRGQADLRARFAE